MPQTVAVIDYGSGNLHSVAKALERAGSCRVIVTSDMNEIRFADRVVLPGVGAMGDCMHGLKDRGLDSVVLDVIQEKPLMGVCVGMQILTEFGEESAGVDALGVFPGQITQFSKSMKCPEGRPLKVPHMGWNDVEIVQDEVIWKDINCIEGFYFLHSYAFFPDNPETIIGTSNYGLSFICAVRSSNIYGFQFHPEKSLSNGLCLLKNFAALS